MPASPEETSATSRPSAASASALRTRASSAPSGESKRSALGDQRRDEIEIERIADRRVARLEAGASPPASASRRCPVRCRRCASFPRARPTVVASMTLRRFGDGAGDARALLLWRRRASRPARRRRAPRPRRRRGSRPRGTRCRRGSRAAASRLRAPSAVKKRAGTPSACRGFEHRRLVGLEVDRGDERDGRLGASPASASVCRDKRDRLGRVGAALAADAEREASRVIDEAELAPDGGAAFVVATRRTRASALCGMRACGEPRRVALEAAPTRRREARP